MRKKRTAETTPRPAAISTGLTSFAVLALLGAGPGIAQQTPPQPPTRPDPGGQQESREVHAEETPTDPFLISMQGRLEQGFSLSASRELARRLSIDDDVATPQLVLLAARAHADARSWNAVRRLLLEREWLDVLDGGRGRILLARAYLALGDPERSVEEFHRAGVETLSTERRVEYAQALWQTGRPEAAARAYREAAVRDADLASWLRLTAVQAWAAAGEPDSALAASSELDARSAVSEDSTFTSLARAYFAAGDTARAIAFADSLSRRSRSRLAGEWLVPALAARGDTARARTEAASAIRYRGVGPEAGRYLVATDRSVETLRRIAEVEAREGRTDDAVDLLSEALEISEASDRGELTLQLAEALFAARSYGRVGRVLDSWLSGDAAAAVEGIPSSLEQRMRFLAGRALYRAGLREAATELWRDVAADPTAEDGPYAAFLLADMMHDRSRLPEARDLYEETVTRFPRSSYAGSALIRLGMLDLVAERPADAAEHFDTYRRRFPGGNWYTASTFWAARARDAAGDSAQARVLYNQVLGDDALGFYGIESARALGEEAWSHMELRATPPVRLRPDHAALVRRMSRLRDMGWKARALRELAARDGPRESRDDRLALAMALNEAGFTWQGTSMAWGVYRARSGIWSEELLRAVYPLIYAPVLRERASAERLDATLVAALVRRESQFDRDVISGAGAIGLMQIMPATGAEVARRVGIAEYRRDQLVVPEVNMTLGTRYLRELLERRSGALVPALISYNAGPHRFVAWRRFPEFSASTELMIERIPFTETRRYVKAILSYRYIYQQLYGQGPNTG